MGLAHVIITPNDSFTKYFIPISMTFYSADVDFQYPKRNVSIKGFNNILTKLEVATPICPFGPLGDNK